MRKRFCRQGLEAALARSLPNRLYERSLDGRTEARLIALACSQAPEGRDRWSMRLLADKKALELGIVESVSHETVRKALKKRAPPPPGEEVGDPAKGERGGVLVWRMEAVLELYKEPHDPLFALVCFDERACQLLADVLDPLPRGRGRLERRDHEYERRGTARG
ncbi:MAG: hypothetical protein AVDCRST_MAG80-176 [uncultured Rubrobacteraceae bacterium]|uniref:Transposase n=1 Tax=uncultured Rubrobacteraceae bacterium TaxID=349277 RepID=A0A6J4Q0V5_9ACTN|nr:MAG: hypothetical protein AVDCRST_MAG80-176 [uncultured Rubrobacteraceae bacterium]